jgi:hypothetical protein
MPIFAVMGLGDQRLGEKIKTQFPNDHLAIAIDKWFVVANNATAQTVASKLGMDPKGENITGIVVTVGGYFGLGPSNFWEWLKAKGSQAPIA